MVTKAEAKVQIEQFMHKWRLLTENEGVPTESLSFQSFWFWISDNYPNLVTFRSTMNPREDCEIWFDLMFGQTSQR